MSEPAGPKSTDDMIAAAMPLARSLARRCAGQGVDDDELESEAMLALVQAARSYRPGGYDRRTWNRWAELYVIGRLRELVIEAPYSSIAEVPRELCRDADRCRRAAGKLAARGIRRPTTEELAYEAMVPIERVRLVLAVRGVVVAQTLAEYADPRSSRDPSEPTLEPAFGPQPGWSPYVTCAVVHTEERPIRPGSKRCCMVCHASGKDGHRALRRDPKTDPPRESKKAPEPAPEKPRKETRHEKRQRLFGPKVA
jgi:hypothetical protein